MYLKRIELENIRCFEYVNIDLSSGDDVQKWAVILGDNGMGKTTVLRSIAMGLCDETSAAGLLRELYGDWVRIQNGRKDYATIYLEFAAKTGSKKAPYIRTVIETTPSGYSKVRRQTTYPKSFSWDSIFVCGYGAARRGFGTKDYDEYAVIDAVYTLFNYDSPLQNPELVIRRLADTKADTKVDLDKIFAWFNKVLMLPPGSISLRQSGLAVKGPWGEFVPIGALGDGYQATIAWISSPALGFCWTLD